MTTTGTNDHTHTYVDTWEEHRHKWEEWAYIIGTAHAYHDLFHEIGDMSIEALNHIVHAHIGGTLKWEADMPNPLEVWQETYEEEMPERITVRQWEVRQWARAYYKAYEDEVYRLTCEQCSKYYRENPRKVERCS